MGESKHNITTLMSATMPTFPKPDRFGAVEIKMSVEKKRHVFFVMPGTEGAPDELKAHAEMLAKNNLPAQVVHEIGKPLPPELCDVVFFLGVQWVDTKSNPQAPRMGGMSLAGEVRRYDYVEFLKHAEASLPEEQHILHPGAPLKVV
jgi:hypothetical protein